MSATSKLTVNIANPANNLIFARVTAAERDAHFNSNNPPELGMLIFNDDDKVLEFWNGEEWAVALGERTGGGGASRYDFQSFEFEESSSASRSGPDTNYVTQRISGNDGWKSNTEYLSVNNGVWEWMAPQTGNYTIEAWGAQGGRSNCYGPNGGTGAYAKGTVQLKGGKKYKIVVGRRGSNNCYDCGGGGMTGIVDDSNQALVVAGGGGGGSACGMNGPGPFQGHTSETGGATAWGPGGSNGQGGSGAGPVGGGGGITGNGGGSWGGQSFLSGAQGGPGPAPGGFGGGGGGGGTYGAGGGGGYGGGAASRWCFYGAGGGSYVTPDATSPSKTAGNKSNGGKIKITKV